MDFEILHDKLSIFNFLRKNPGLYVYLIGDLDDFFWPNTVWYVVRHKYEIQAIALLYVGMSPPTLLLFYESGTDASRQLLESIKPVLPTKFNAHLSPELVKIFGKQNIIKDYGYSYKMVLKKPVEDLKDKHIRRLTEADLPFIKDFYREAYPDNWFDSRMLKTTKYFGFFEEERLVGVSGVHVYSEDYGVAALGNIATHPDFRGRQIGYRLTAALCHDIQQRVKVIGLNVKAGNEYAIRCYKKVGFEIVSPYDECLIRNDAT